MSVNANDSIQLLTLLGTAVIGALQLYTALQVTKIKYWAVTTFVRREDCTSPNCKPYNPKADVEI